MEVYVIRKDGKEINTILAGEAFARDYCARRGYTYERLEDPAPPPAPEGRMEALEAAVEDADEMNIDQEYRLTLLELGLTDTEI